MERSTTVIFEEAKTGRWVRARAVERPKTPEPRIKISFGVAGEAIDAVALLATLLAKEEN